MADSPRTEDLENKLATRARNREFPQPEGRGSSKQELVPGRVDVGG